MDVESVNSQDFLPTNESARIAVERARQIVKDNNEMILRLKSESSIEYPEADHGFDDAESFSPGDLYGFDLYKIKSSNGVKDFLKNMFGVN